MNINLKDKVCVGKVNSMILFTFYQHRKAFLDPERPRSVFFSPALTGPCWIISNLTPLKDCLPSITPFRISSDFRGSPFEVLSSHLVRIPSDGICRGFLASLNLPKIAFYLKVLVLKAKTLLYFLARLQCL